MEQHIYIRDLSTSRGRVCAAVPGDEGLSEPWRAVLAQLPLTDAALSERAAESAVAAALDFDLLPLLIDAWSKLKEIEAALADTTKIAVIPLFGHTFASNSHPEIEVLVSGVRVTTVTLDLRLEIAIEGAVLTIQDGEFRSIDLGNLKGRALLGIAGRELLQQDFGEALLPLRLELGARTTGVAEASAVTSRPH